MAAAKTTSTKKKVTTGNTAVKKTQSKKSTSKNRMAEPSVTKVEQSCAFESTIGQAQSGNFNSYPVNQPVIETGSMLEKISTGISELDTDADLSGDERPVDGGFNISRKVLAQIALIASKEVSGFVPPRRDIVSRMTNLLQGRTEGIKVEIGTTEAAVDVLVRVRYGTDIPTFSTNLRKTIARRIFEMTGLRVVEANVRILDVAPTPPQEET